MCPGNSTPANKMRIELADENAEPSSKKGSWLFLPVSFLSDGAEARNSDHKSLKIRQWARLTLLALGSGPWGSHLAEKSVAPALSTVVLSLIQQSNSVLSENLNLEQFAYSVLFSWTDAVVHWHGKPARERKPEHLGNRKFNLGRDNERTHGFSLTIGNKF